LLDPLRALRITSNISLSGAVSTLVVTSTIKHDESDLRRRMVEPVSGLSIGRFMSEVPDNF
jgi:hypothetical protein